MDNESYPFSRLFIIGNGFDKAHDYKTDYYHFRDWMEQKLKEINPEIRLDNEGHIIADVEPEIPFVTIDMGDRESVDEKEALYMLMWILLLEMKSDSEWNEFESELYYLDIESVIINNGYYIDNVTKDRDGVINPFYADAEYSNLVSNLRVSMALLTELFEQWIEEIDISFLEKDASNNTKQLLSIRKLMNENCLYLSFNYTETLEKIYNVPGYLVDHIHGLRKRGKKYYDSCSAFPNTVGKIVVGHGEDKSRNFDIEYIEREYILQEIIRDFRKPVDSLLDEHREFWSYIFHGGVNEIYSFGFSYSDVDIPYIKQIVASLKNGKDVTWFLNSFDNRPDANNPGFTLNQRYEYIIRKCGFQGHFKIYDSK